MKIIEAINRVDDLKPNDYDFGMKIIWLSKLDGTIKSEIIDTHEDSNNIDFSGYTDANADNTELLVPFPYDDIYINYLKAQIDFANGEIAKYNNDMAMFNTDYENFAKYYNSQHMPKNTKIKYF